jgi:integrase
MLANIRYFSWYKLWYGQVADMAEQQGLEALSEGKPVKRPDRKRHPVNALVPTALKTLKPGRHGDGGGLYLVVDENGARRWVLRVTIHGKRHDIGLGGFPTKSLASARVEAATMRAVARDDGDPLAAGREASFKNQKHAAQWLQTLVTYANPVFGNVRVDKITSGDVLKVLEPIWNSKPETARRVRQRLVTVFKWCKAKQYMTGDNPVDGVDETLPEQTHPVKHFAAMPYHDVPAFIVRLANERGSDLTRLGLELLVLTALRTGEMRQGLWAEIDFTEAIWTVPASRQLKKKKNATPHVVPLVPRAVEILNRLKALSGDSEFIFPGHIKGKSVSDMTFLMALRRLGVENATNHGFRSSFKDWASEETDHSNIISEKSLAHGIKDKAEAAYRRGKLLAKRRSLMEDWAKYIGTPRSVPIMVAHSP